MDRGLKAAFLFSLLVVAQADRALHAHKPSTGGLHAVALLRSVPAVTTPSTATSEFEIKSFGNYMITNGNGTWTYSYYSNNGNLNGNDGGMGGDYSFHNQNPAWFNANAAVGNAVAAIGALVPSFDDTTTAGGVSTSTQLESPLGRYTLGLTSVAFTGAKTGIAVGRFGGFSDYDQIDVAEQAVANFAFVPAAIGEAKLNILLTYDGATTWVRATGLPKQDAIVAVATTLIAGQWGTTAATPPYPALTVGDLTSVFMASKSMGWAVGGNDVTLAGVISSVNTLGVTAGFSAAGVMNVPNALEALATSTPLGLVLMTQNGGSVWKNVPIYISKASLTTLYVNNDPSLKNIFGGLIPGILFSIQSDASGKHVYAVGSASTKWSGSVTSQIDLSNNLVAPGGVALALQVKPFGTIIYSGNSGMSWVQQTAPTLYSGTAAYALYSVAVQKGTTAIAVGGSPFEKYGDKSAGTIVYTMNGGFSWTQAVYPSSTGSKAPVFTCVALQPSMTGAQAVWVGGYTVRSDTLLAGVTLPPKAVDFYPVAAVTGFNPTITAAGALGTPSLVGSGVSRVKGQIYTLLVSKDSGKTFAAAPTAGLPTGFVVTAYSALDSDSLATDRSVYGITWDNASHGWIYGFGFIMSTQDGGATWVYETPADVGVISVTPKVLSIASVPTTY